MRLAATFATLALVAAPARTQDAAPEPVALPALTSDNFATWFRALTPSAAEEAWQTIPWRPTFWDAVVEAQAADKPVLLWAMNGHPLACT